MSYMNRSIGLLIIVLITMCLGLFIIDSFFVYDIDEVPTIEDTKEQSITTVYEYQYETLTKYNFGEVFRIHDDELNVTCYVLAEYKAGGLSCIPDNQIYNNNTSYKA